MFTPDPTLVTQIQINLTTLGAYRGAIDGEAGSKTWEAIGRLSQAATKQMAFPASVALPIQSNVAWLKGDGTWPFEPYIDGNDIRCDDIYITTFGGNGDGTNSDPQDDGQTASGKNTNNRAYIGCALPMDGRAFLGLSPYERRALDGSPIPRLPWGTPVEVTIDGKTIVLPHGVIDLGPGKQASKPGQPHALDLTVQAAALFAPDLPLNRLATTFKRKGSFRIINGAKLMTSIA